jgi:GTP cyclohydrolase I
METIPTNAQTLESAVKIILQAYDNPEREGLKDTPRRYIKFLDEFHNQGKDFKFTTFETEGANEMIIQKGIRFYSLCEHHLAPFFGEAIVAYIPDKKIVGLSKLARCVDFYARNFQNQERITMQIAQRIQDELNPLGVAVVLKAKHFCMEMRGIKTHGAETTTRKLIGLFETDAQHRQEFLNCI